MCLANINSVTLVYFVRLTCHILYMLHIFFLSWQSRSNVYCVSASLLMWFTFSKYKCMSLYIVILSWISMSFNSLRSRDTRVCHSKWNHIWFGYGSSGARPLPEPIIYLLTWDLNWINLKIWFAPTYYITTIFAPTSMCLSISDMYPVHSVYIKLLLNVPKYSNSKWFYLIIGIVLVYGISRLLMTSRYGFFSNQIFKRKSGFDSNQLRDSVVNWLHWKRFVLSLLMLLISWYGHSVRHLWLV